MKKISIIGIIYLAVFTLLTLGIALEFVASVASGALASFPLLLLFFPISGAFSICGIIWSSALRAHKSWTWPWGVVFVSFNLIITIVYSVFSFSIVDIIPVLFGGFILYALVSEKTLFFPVQSDSMIPSTNPWRTLIVPTIAFVILSIGSGLVYYYFYYSVVHRVLPQQADIFVQTAITDNLAQALTYSIPHQNNFNGYQPTLLNEAPKCSGPLTENISPDGSQLAVFGKSCTNPSVYYCSAMSLSMARMGSDNNFNEPMQTVPASLVTATKYDCSIPSTAGLNGVASPPQSSSTLPPNGPTPGIVIFGIKYIADIPQASQIVASLGVTNCKVEQPEDPGVLTCSVPIGKEDQIIKAALNNPKIGFSNRTYGQM